MKIEKITINTANEGGLRFGTILGKSFGVTKEEAIAYAKQSMQYGLETWEGHPPSKEEQEKTYNKMLKIIDEVYGTENKES